MTKKSLLEATARMLGLTVDFSEESDRSAALGACCDYVLNELSTQHEDLLNTETIVSSDKKLLFSRFRENVVRVRSVKKDGRKVSFTFYPDHVRVDRDGEYDVTYTYSIKSPLLNEWIKLPPKYTENILSLGVAAEYLYRTGYERDAAMFSDRYYTALKNLSVVKRNVVLPARRFL